MGDLLHVLSSPEPRLVDVANYFHQPYLFLSYVTLLVDAHDAVSASSIMGLWLQRPCQKVYVIFHDAHANS
uniref:Uncharacterized protein n=1 Tax=Setaria italica TaxID=4555 RepID=K3YNN8_SETIT